MNSLFVGDSKNFYDQWESPMVIVSDGPYGIGGYEGDPTSVKELPNFYEEHIKKWTEKSTAETTLWFWNTEVGWAVVHPILEKHGWIYRGCNIWDKGIKHIAGNCNGKTMRKFPVVTEVCVHYVRKEEFTHNGEVLTLQDWLRKEWKRSGLSFSKANEACEVKNAASRKYLTSDHLWYCPPQEEFEKLVNYANKYGESSGKPYFSKDGKTSLSGNQWNKLRAKFNFEYGTTNVWSVAQLRNQERLKNGMKIQHPNQKPLQLMDRIIQSSSDVGDLIWEPFLGLGSASLSAYLLGRNYVGAELNPIYFEMVKERINNAKKNKEIL